MKERIIGAAVLVVFVVLVVPVFLDGPPGEDEIVSARVMLPGQEDQKSQTVVLDRDRSEPVPAMNAPAPQPQNAQTATPRQDPVREKPAPQPVAEQPSPAPAAQEPEPEPQPEPKPKPVPAQAAASTTGMWAVQLGSFSNKENAEGLAARLRKQGYAAFLSQVTNDAGTVLHRVRIGPQKDRESAEAMAARLLKVGHKGQVVPHP